MDKLQKQILAEKENVEIALENLKLAKSKKEKTVIELAAMYGVLMKKSMNIEHHYFSLYSSVSHVL